MAELATVRQGPVSQPELELQVLPMQLLVSLHLLSLMVALALARGLALWLTLGLGLGPELGLELQPGLRLASMPALVLEMALETA